MKKKKEKITAKLPPRYCNRPRPRRRRHLWRMTLLPSERDGSGRAFCCAWPPIGVPADVHRASRRIASSQSAPDQHRCQKNPKKMSPTAHPIPSLTNTPLHHSPVLLTDFSPLCAAAHTPWCSSPREKKGEGRKLKAYQIE